jgi:glycosyltransferase involved in cell wall biosynthesis
VRRANGGLAFRSGAEFEEALAYLLSQERERSAMGQQGLEYVEREYRWPTVMSRVEQLLQEVRCLTPGLL